MSRDALYERIYDIVQEVPAGRVATYGQVARIAGCTARVTGYAMAAVAAGMRTLYQDGLRKAAEGITSIEEVLRVTWDG